MNTKTMDTKTLIDEYFDTQDKIVIYKNKPTIDRPELYEYEKKIGKKLLEMNEDELLEMISTFKRSNEKIDEHRNIAFSSYPSISRWFKKIWEYYCENYEFIRNPWYSSKLKGVYAREYLSRYADVFSQNDFDHLLEVIKERNDADTADYLECMLRLVYDGIENAREIISITEKDIDFNSKTIYLSGHLVKLSDRTCFLLRRVHFMEQMQSGNIVLEMASWHDSYLKFRCRKSNADALPNWSVTQMTVKVSHLFTETMTKQLGKQVVIKQINVLGEFAKLISYFGYDEAKRLISSKKNVENNHALMKFLNDNGYRQYVSNLKYDMIPYFYQN